MNPISIVGAFIMTLSLLAYGIGSISIKRFKMVGSIVLIFLSMGIIFDITAIILMIIGSKGTPFTFHGFVGYLAFLVMLVDTVWAWCIYFKRGLDKAISVRYLWYSQLSYLLWILGYLTGSLIVLWR